MKKIVCLSMSLAAVVSLGACSSSSPKLAPVATTKAAAEVTTTKAGDTATSTILSSSSSDSAVELPAMSAEVIKKMGPVLVPMLTQQGYSETEAKCVIDKVLLDADFLKLFGGVKIPVLENKFQTVIENTVLKCVSVERLAEIGAKKNG